MQIIVGSHVWVEDPVLAWIDGEVASISGHEVHVNTTNGKRVSGKSMSSSLYLFDDLTVPSNWCD